MVAGIVEIQSQRWNSVPAKAGRVMKRFPKMLTLMVVGLALTLVAACGGGLDQEDVDAAVQKALAEAEADEGPSFYEGKTIRLLVGFSAGGGYDTYARAISRHIGKHIPGNPDIIVENMTGAGSLVAANHLYNQAKPDGLTLGSWNSAHLLIEALEGNEGILFSGERFGYIGAPSDGNPVCAVMGHAGLSGDDLLGGTVIKFGATGAFGSAFSDTVRLMNEFLGTDIELVTGYRGSSRVRLGMQEKEVAGGCFGWESMAVTARAMLDAEGDDKLIPFATVFKSDDPELAGLPSIRDLITDEANKVLFDVWSVGYRFQRPWTTPPGTPEDRIETLRAAFAATMVDPAFLADAEQAGLAISAISGAQVEEWVLETLRISADTKEAMQFLVPSE